MNMGDVCIVCVDDWTVEEYFRFCQYLKREYKTRVNVAELSFNSLQHINIEQEVESNGSL